MRVKVAVFGWAVAALLATGGCKDETRDRECSEWADWSNAQNAMVFSQISSAEREGADSNAKQAANYTAVSLSRTRDAGPPASYRSHGSLPCGSD